MAVILRKYNWHCSQSQTTVRDVGSRGLVQNASEAASSIMQPHPHGLRFSFVLPARSPANQDLRLSPARPPLLQGAAAHRHITQHIRYPTLVHHRIVDIHDVLSAICNLQVVICYLISAI